ncbi:DEAD/DEAH box helicase [Candidatus Pacearchaeota archaeon]|nr:DEAD/DEAH box helicase [Candidatus Pacearchaeota archaeon]
MEKFKKLGLGERTLRVISSMNFEEPSEIQAKTIPLALEGKDVVAASKTGSGKTLAFAAPIIENIKPNGDIQALILTPTRELADQVGKQIDIFAEGRLNVLEIYGGVDITRQIRKMSRADVVVGTPGRILDHLNRRTINLTNIKILVLDEFDRMLDMGFSRDVDQIIREAPENRQTMLFSATIGSGIDHLIDKYTKKDAHEVIVESFLDTSKLTQVFYDTPSNMKFSLLVHLLKAEKAGLVMVFCNTRRNADFIVKNLNSLGIESKAIHGGLDQKKRIRVLEEFHGKGANVVVCTDVAARGLDIKGVSHVYNYDIPKEVDDYIHRIGRTARAGTSGKAINILSSRDYESFSDIERHEQLDVKKLEMPYVERIMIRMDDKRDFGRGGASRGRDQSRGRSGGNSRFGGGNRSGGRSQGGRSFGNRDSGSSRGPRRNFSEGTDRHSSRNFNKGDGDSGRKFGNRDSNRSQGGRSFGNRDSGSNSGGKSYGNKSYGNNNSGRSQGGRSFGNKSYGNKDSGKSYGNRDSGKSYGNKESGSSYGNRDSNSRQGSSRGPRRDSRKSFGNKSQGRGRRDNRR